MRSRQRRAQLDELTARVVTEGLAIWSGNGDEQKSLIVCGRSHLLEDVRAMEDLERVRLLFQDLDTKKDLIQLLGLAERAEGVRIFIGSENKLFSLSGSSLDRLALRGHRAEDRGRARRDRPDAAQLCPHHPHGRLHGPPAWPPCPLIFGGPRSISRLRLSSDPFFVREPMSDDTDRHAGHEDQAKPANAEHAKRRPPTRRRKPSAELAALVAENADMRDRLLRTMADMENLRRRTEREKTDTARYAISNFARDVLTVGDNLRRTIEHVPAEAASQDPALKSFLDGVELTERELLQRARASRRDAHRAARGSASIRIAIRRCTRCRTPSVPEGTVVDVMQAGYVIGDRCLRPALVAVAKGGAKAAAQPRLARGRARRPMTISRARRREPPRGQQHRPAIGGHSAARPESLAASSPGARSG